MNESASPRNWRRSTKACDFCVQRKLRCDKSTQDHDARPCSNCLRFGRECKFTKPTLKRGRRAESLSQDASIPPSAQGASTHDATPSGTGHHAEGYGAPMFAGLQVLSSAISMDEGGSSLKYLDRDLPTPPLDLIPHLHDTFVANVHHDFPITPRPPLTFTTRFLSLALCRAAVPFSNHPHLLTPPMSRTHLSLALETHFQDYMKLWISGELPPDLTSVQSLCVMASALSGTAHGDHNKVKRMVGMAVQQAQELDLARGTTREEVLTWVEVLALDRACASQARPPLVAYAGRAMIDDFESMVLELLDIYAKIVCLRIDADAPDTASSLPQYLSPYQLASHDVLLSQWYARLPAALVYLDKSLTGTDRTPMAPPTRVFLQHYAGDTWLFRGASVLCVYHALWSMVTGPWGLRQAACTGTTEEEVAEFERNEDAEDMAWMAGTGYLTCAEHADAVTNIVKTVYATGNTDLMHMNHPLLAFALATTVFVHILSLRRLQRLSLTTDPVAASIEAAGSIVLSALSRLTTRRDTNGWLARVAQGLGEVLKRCCVPIEGGEFGPPGGVCPILTQWVWKWVAAVNRGSGWFTRRVGANCGVDGSKICQAQSQTACGV